MVNTTSIENIERIVRSKTVPRPQSVVAESSTKVVKAQNVAAVGTNSHWDRVYESRSDDQLSWDQDQPERSLRLIQEYAPELASRIVDAGAGRSKLVDHLLELGYRDITLIDLSQVALDDVRRRLGADATSLRFLVGDVAALEAVADVDVWHDRAVFHFLTNAEARRKYVSVVARSVRSGGVAIVATFAKGGPTQCSGLPVCQYDAFELAREFGADFSLIHQEREVHLTPNGAPQPFVYAVLKRVERGTASARA